MLAEEQGMLITKEVMIEVYVCYKGPNTQSVQDRLIVRDVTLKLLAHQKIWPTSEEVETFFLYRLIGYLCV